MIYSVYFNSESVAKDPTLLSKVRQDEFGWRVKRNAVAYKGKCRFQAESSDYFSQEGGKTYVSRVLTNPTYGTLFKHATKAQQVTKDFHHEFFEGVWVQNKQEDVAVILPCLGS